MGVIVSRLDSIPLVSAEEFVMRYGESAGDMAAGAASHILGHIPSDDGSVLRCLEEYDPKATPPQTRTRWYVALSGPAICGKDVRDVPGSPMLREFYGTSCVAPAEIFAPFEGAEVSMFEITKYEQLHLEPAKAILRYVPYPFSLAELPSEDTVVRDVYSSECQHPFIVERCVEKLGHDSELSDLLIELIREYDLRGSGNEMEYYKSGSEEELVRQKDPMARWFRDLYEKYFRTFYGREAYRLAMRVYSSNEPEGYMLAQTVGLLLIGAGRFAIEKITAKDRHHKQLLKALKKLQRCLRVHDEHNAVPIYSEKLARIGRHDRRLLEREFEPVAKLTRLLHLEPLDFVRRALALPVVKGTCYLRTLVTHSECEYDRRLRERSNRRVIELGEELERPRKAILLVDDLCKSVLNLGMPGSGKTVTNRNLCYHLWNQHHIPFIIFVHVIDPYRDLFYAKGALGGDVRIFTAGDPSLSHFAHNILEIQTPGVSVIEHTPRVIEVFAAHSKCILTCPPFCSMPF
jgi:hypothetical protein